MTENEHVSRIDVLVLVERLNQLERVVPIYRQALAQIAGEHVADPKRVAHHALREADHPTSED